MISKFCNYEIFFKKSESGQFCGCFWYSDAHLVVRKFAQWKISYLIFLIFCYDLSIAKAKQISKSGKLWKKWWKVQFQVNLFEKSHFQLDFRRWNGPNSIPSEKKAMKIGSLDKWGFSDFIKLEFRKMNLIQSRK